MRGAGRNGGRRRGAPRQVELGSGEEAEREAWYSLVQLVKIGFISLGEAERADGGGRGRGWRPGPNGRAGVGGRALAGARGGGVGRGGGGVHKLCVWGRGAVIYVCRDSGGVRWG